jgi:hypothetical protein
VGRRALFVPMIPAMRVAVVLAATGCGAPASPRGVAATLPPRPAPFPTAAARPTAAAPESPPPSVPQFAPLRVAPTCNEQAPQPFLMRSTYV